MREALRNGTATQELKLAGPVHGEKPDGQNQSPDGSAEIREISNRRKSRSKAREINTSCRHKLVGKAKAILLAAFGVERRPGLLKHLGGRWLKSSTNLGKTRTRHFINRTISGFPLAFLVQHATKHHDGQAAGIHQSSTHSTELTCLSKCELKLRWGKKSLHVLTRETLTIHNNSL